MKLCPHCQNIVQFYVNEYRCSRCHLWLPSNDILEVNSRHTPANNPVGDAASTRPETSRPLGLPLAYGYS